MLRARDLVQGFYIYYYEGIKVSIGNKDEIDFRPAGATDTLCCNKEEIIRKLSTMDDDEEIFGVPKSFMMECLENAEYREKNNV